MGRYWAGGACYRSQGLKLLVGSGGLDFTKGMDSLDKHVEQISFGQWITFFEHGQLKGWQPQPRFQPTKAKSSISTILHWLAAVAYIRQPRSQSIACNPKLGYHNSIFCKHDGTILSWWSVLLFRDLKLLVGSGGLDFTKGMDSLDKHVEQISFGQWITFFEHGQLKGWQPQPRFQPTKAKSSISTILHWLAAVAYIRQPRSQSIACNPKLGYHNSIFCKHDGTILSWWSVLLFRDSSFW